MAGTIVVGVDGSPASQAALEFAAEEAGLRKAKLVAVHAWSYVSPPPVGDLGMTPMEGGDVPGLLEAERAAAGAALSRALEKAFPTPASVEVEPRLVEGDPAEALVSEAAGADLIVVGSRGRGDVASALLGSVSSHVVQHADCPVVVVRAPR
jgi:nucleotide-binding universal stress UspA family protein